jgi:hypothetical protein
VVEYVVLRALLLYEVDILADVVIQKLFRVATNWRCWRVWSHSLDLQWLVVTFSLFPACRLMCRLVSDTIVI